MTVDLNVTCGLALKLDTDKPQLIFGEGLNFSKTTVRTLMQMREVLLDKGIRRPLDLYYMYRDVYRLADKTLLEKHNLRYDVTVIKPDSLGRELMKTAGHYHPSSFGELYEVIFGRCLCLLQRPNQKELKTIEEVILVEARAAQKIVIPPYFGHILINPGPDYLVTSNWVSSVFTSEYDLYKKAQGAAYFVIKSAQGKLEYLANPYFDGLPKIKFKFPAKQLDKFGLLEGEPMYNVINQDAERLDFLNHPLDFDYADVFI